MSFKTRSKRLHLLLLLLCPIERTSGMGSLRASLFWSKATSQPASWVLRPGWCGVTDLKLMRTGVCPRLHGGFQTTWPHIVLTAIVNSGWPNGGITAGKQYFCCSSTLLLCFCLSNLTEFLNAIFVPSTSEEKVLSLSFIHQVP